ncbi:MAG: hypothetical protein ACD_75C00271G0001, partial [uncultured bacterium]
MNKYATLKANANNTIKAKSKMGEARLVSWQASDVARLRRNFGFLRGT